MAVRPDLHQGAADGDAGDHLARHGAGRHPRRRLARRRAAAAAIIADAVLGPVGVVGVAGPELVRDVAVVLGALIDVLDHQRDRRARGDLAARASSANTPDRIFTASGSCRCVVKRDWPGRRLSRCTWMSAAVSAMPGGQPSTTQPRPARGSRPRWSHGTDGRRCCATCFSRGPKTAYCLLPTAYCLLPTAYCLLPTASPTWLAACTGHLSLGGAATVHRARRSRHACGRPR